MIRFIVPALPLRQMKGIGKVSQKPYDFHVQTVYVHTVDLEGKPSPFPEKAEISHDNAADAYQPGEYQLAPASIYVDRQGRVAIGAKLVPLKPRAA